MQIMIASTKMLRIFLQMVNVWINIPAAGVFGGSVQARVGLECDDSELRLEHIRTSETLR